MGDVGDIDVEISTGYLATVGKDRITDEVRGILLHEMTSSGPSAGSWVTAS